MIDTHAHLDSAEFAQDIEAIVARAASAGVTAMVTVGVDIDTSRQAVALAETHPCIVAAVGVHPHHADTWSQSRAELRSLAASPRVVAIGEIGLDYYRRRAPVDLQRQAFLEQLTLARELRLPVIVHDRDAHDDVMERIRAETKQRDNESQPTGAIHCFSGDLEMMLAATRLGFFISFAGSVTYPKAGDLNTVAAAVPKEWLLIETDSPFLAPQPVRGKRNEPAYLAMVLNHLAGLRSEAVDVLARQTLTNAIKLFGPALAAAANRELNLGEQR